MLYSLLGIFFALMISLLSIYLRINSLKKKKLLYDIDETKKIKITKDIIYKTVYNKNLLMDIYTPENLENEEKLPVVIFVHGEGPEFFIRDAKEWGIYSSYGKLLSGMGFAAVTFNHRYAAGDFKKINNVSKDVNDAVDYIIENASQWNIDSEKICIWSFSLGGIYSSLFLTEKKVKCLVSYYGFLDIYAKVLKIDDIYWRFTPSSYLLGLEDNDTSILIVKAAKDKIKGINRSIDSFIEVAKEYGVKYEYIVHNTGGHSFDVLDDNEETRKVIKQTLNFIQENCR